MTTAAKGHLTVVKALLAAGADPNAKGATFHYGDFSVLMAAMQPENKDWLRIIDALIAAGAEVNPTGAFARFPLAHAVESRSVEMVDALLTRGADVNSKNPSGMTALMGAVVGLSPEMVRHLIIKGADVKARTKDGETALSLMRQVLGEYSREVVTLRMAVSRKAVLITLTALNVNVCTYAVTGAHAFHGTIAAFFGAESSTTPR